MEFFLWGKLKQKVYNERSITPVDMKNRIRTIATIDLETIERSLQSLITHFRQCIIVKGQHFLTFTVTIITCKI